jgi:hypothetical protein
VSRNGGKGLLVRQLEQVDGALQLGVVRSAADDSVESESHPATEASNGDRRVDVRSMQWMVFAFGDQSFQALETDGGGGV